MPLISSEPIFSKATFGVSSGNKADYIKPHPFQKSQLSFYHRILHWLQDLKQHSYFFRLAIILLKLVCLQTSIVLSNILEITKRTPVLPADKVIFESDSICELIEFHMLLSFEFFIAVNGVSSSETTVLDGKIL